MQPILHHPSQLYEMVFEGIILFTILYFLRKKKFFRHQMVSCYLIGYGFFRFCIEFFRRPDAHLGRLDLFGMSRGQTLCSLMIITGIALFIFTLKKSKQKEKLTSP
jgi:phosphatidylglycerol:prolipoprotein diacylglycerol transferase